MVPVVVIVSGVVSGRGWRSLRTNPEGVVVEQAPRKGAAITTRRLATPQSTFTIAAWARPEARGKSMTVKMTPAWGGGVKLAEVATRWRAAKAVAAGRVRRGGGGVGLRMESPPRGR